METKTAVSAGGVIFRREDGKLEIAVASRERGRIWHLPKGIVEEGESLKEAAVREVREETGLLGELVEKIGQVDYWFYWKSKDLPAVRLPPVCDSTEPAEVRQGGARQSGRGTRYHKFVHFYLLKFKEGDIGDHDFEVDEVKWLPIDEAKELLSYKSEKEVVEKAKRLLEKMVDG